MSDCCVICSEEHSEPINVAPCNHRYCKKCIQIWLCFETTCPLCRQQVETVQLEKLREQGLEIQYENTPMLHIVYWENEQVGALTKVAGSALLDVGTHWIISALLTSALLTQETKPDHEQLTFDMMTGLVVDAVRIAKQQLSATNWSNSLLGHPLQLRPPFTCVGTAMIGLEIKSETLSIREGALKEWWERHKTSVLAENTRLVQER